MKNSIRNSKNKFIISTFSLLLIIYILPIGELLLHKQNSFVTADTTYAKDLCVNNASPTNAGLAPNTAGGCPQGFTLAGVPDDFTSCNSGSTLQTFGIGTAIGLGAARCYKADGTRDSDGGLLGGDPQGNYSSSASWTDWANFIISGAFLIYLSGMLLYFAGYLLNGSIQLFVVEMGTQLSKGTTLGDAIITCWGIIRDIINLTFVFGMIYLAFMTIVKADTSKLKHGVIQIVIAALLINFSLFFGKAVIDFGNVAALEIYTYMESKAESPNGDQLNYGISGFFVDRMGLGQFFDAKKLIANGDNPTLAFDNKTGFGFAILVSIVLLIASFVFFAGAILISIRFISLALLLVLSPVAFAKAALPGINTEEWSREWWKRLVSQVIFLPAYFLMLYISMSAVGVSNKGSDMTSFFKGGGGMSSVQAFLNFVIIIGFLIGSLIIAKKMGAYGASTVNSWGKSARMYGQRALGSATLGIGAKVGRGTFGRLGSFGANSGTLKDSIGKSGVRAFVNRRLLDASRVAEKTSFDARQVGGLGKNLGIGEGKTGGWKKSMEDVAARDKAYAESAGTVGDDDPRVVGLKALVEHEEHELSKLKNAKELAKTQGEKDDIDEAIHKQEKTITGAKEAVDREKNRRQAGKAVSTAEMASFAESDDDLRNTISELKNSKDSLTSAKESYSHATTNEARGAALKNIADAQKNIKRLEEMREKRLDKIARGKDVGYAGLLDSYSDESTKLGMARGAIASALVGRTRSMSRASAKAVRDTKIKAKKEEKKAKKDGPASAGAKKDGAGGGDDAHEGGHDAH